MHHAFMSHMVKHCLSAIRFFSVIAVALFAGSAFAQPGPGWGQGYGPGPWMMGGWGGGPMMGYGGGGWIMMIFGAVIVVALLVFIFRASAWTSHVPHQPQPHSRANSAGLHALDERYARGEINRAEYLQKKRDILEG